MTGGTPTHALLQARVVTALTNALGPRGCKVYGSDLMVRIPATGLTTYPDVTVVCGRFQADADTVNAATNPVVLVEVLSPSTERWDRGDKFAHYRKLESLREYVLVSQDWQWVERYVRQDDDTWTYRGAGPTGRVGLSSLGVQLVADDLDADTEVPRRAAPAGWRARASVDDPAARGLRLRPEAAARGCGLRLRPEAAARGCGPRLRPEESGRPARP